MSDLTRAIAEALGCQPYARRSVPKDGPLLYCRTHDGTHDQSEGWPCADVTKTAAALAPLIEARVREARAEGAAGALTAFAHEVDSDDAADLAAYRAMQWEAEAAEVRNA